MRDYWRRKGKTVKRRRRARPDPSGERADAYSMFRLKSCDWMRALRTDNKLAIGFHMMGVHGFEETRDLRVKPRKYWPSEMDAISRFQREQEQLAAGILDLREAQERAEYAHVWGEDETCMLCGTSANAYLVTGYCSWIMESQGVPARS